MIFLQEEIHAIFDHFNIVYDKAIMYTPENNIITTSFYYHTSHTSHKYILTEKGFVRHIDNKTIEEILLKRKQEILLKYKRNKSIKNILK